jgi:hypothetical protein
MPWKELWALMFSHRMSAGFLHHRVFTAKQSGREGSPRTDLGGSHDRASRSIESH